MCSEADTKLSGGTGVDWWLFLVPEEEGRLHLWV